MATAQTRVAVPGANSLQTLQGGGTDPQTLIQQWQQSHPYGSAGSSVQDLNAFLNAHGVQSQIPTHAGGTHNFEEFWQFVPADGQQGPRRIPPVLFRGMWAARSAGPRQTPRITRN